MYCFFATFRTRLHIDALRVYFMSCEFSIFVTIRNGLVLRMQFKSTLTNCFKDMNHFKHNQYSTGTTV